MLNLKIEIKVINSYLYFKIIKFFYYGAIVLELEYSAERILDNSSKATTPLPFESQPYDKHLK
jgi:hypothetical protein